MSDSNRFARGLETEIGLASPGVVISLFFGMGVTREIFKSEGT